MFSKSEKYYDAVYEAAGKNYTSEVNKIHKFILKYKRAEGNTLLDVACGTGAHTGPLSEYYKAEGLDLDTGMVRVACKKYPKIRFHRGDMIDFKLDHPFHVIMCLFSSIGYVRTKSNLYKAIQNMEQHLLPRGVLLVEPWFTPDQWNPGRVFVLRVEKQDLKIIRMSRSGQRGRLSSIEFQYLIGTSKGIEHSVEHHTLGLFTHEEYLEAFQAAGLQVIHNKRGLDGRGLYIGRKPIE